jgi:DNA-binding response OmpR family regulator
LPQITVLYVEDHDLVLYTVKQLLELEGWKVEVCRDGEEALRRIAGPEHYDLLILEAELPAGKGLDLLRRARAFAHRRSTPIIVFTAHDCSAEATQAGADAWLKKPTGLKDLLDTCYRVLKHSRDAGEHSADEAGDGPD